MRVFSYFVGALQGITEAFPVSSSLHLQIFGITNVADLHLVTGISGVVYLFLTGILLEVSRDMIAAFIDLLQNAFADGIALKCGVTIVVSIGIMLAKSRISSSTDRITIAILSGTIASVFMLVAELSDPHKEKRFSKEDLLLSIICNMLAIIPGVSRLGAVYSGMRIAGHGNRDALRISVVQGAIITMIPTSMAGLGQNIGPSVVCAALYIFLLRLLLTRSDKVLRWIIIGCCAYRIAILPLILQMC